MLTHDEIVLAKATKLSENFSLYELIRSSSKPELVQYPSTDIISKLRMHCEDILQPLRDKFGAIRINSGYRNAELNSAVGGVKNSIHQIYYLGKYLGTASDITPSDERDLVKVMCFAAKKIPAVRRIIIYRDTSALGISTPFLHIDRSVDVPAGEIILLEKTGRGVYQVFDEDEFEPYL